jgi:hypothetical protein
MKKLLLGFLLTIILVSCSTNYERKNYVICYYKQNGMITNLYGQIVNNVTIIPETENTLLLNINEDIETVKGIDGSVFQTKIINNNRCRLTFDNGVSDITYIKIVTFKII